MGDGTWQKLKKCVVIVRNSFLIIIAEKYWANMFVFVVILGETSHMVVVRITDKHGQYLILQICFNCGNEFYSAAVKFCPFCDSGNLFIRPVEREGIKL